MNCKNRLLSRLRSPSRLASDLPLLSISASRSIKSTISLVRLQSNSLTVHLVCSRTSSLSSVDKKGRRSPLYKSINSFALTVEKLLKNAQHIIERLDSLGELEFEELDIEEIEVEDGEMVITTSFENFGSMQKALESRGLVLVSAELQRMPASLINLSDEEKEQVENLIDKLEDDEDVQSVYSNIA